MPLPFEGTVSYGSGTARGPAAILEASTQVELWDDELEFDLERLRYHTTDPITPAIGASVEDWLARVEESVRSIVSDRRLTIGIGGEHSLTAAVVRAVAQDTNDLSGLTVVQIDAHADLRDTYDGTAYSHACVMRRLVESGAAVIAIGVRSMSREEHEFARDHSSIRLFRAQDLATTPGRESQLLDCLRHISGDVYLTIDVDGLTPSLSPGTGTPEPGGLNWWQTLQYLRTLLVENNRVRLMGGDVVETVPVPGTQVGEFTSARLIAKIVALAHQRKP